MKFAIWDHAGKGGYLRQSLMEAGHLPADEILDADLLLVDCDWEWAHPRPELIKDAHDAGIKVALFPHAGLPTIFVYDGLTKPDPRVSLRLEHGHGNVEIAEQLGLDLKQASPGWLYCPTQPFTPVKDPVRVLFAPAHPNIEALLAHTNGHDPAPGWNRKVYQDLLDLGYEVTVTVVGPAWRNGIWPHPRARFVENHQMLFHHSYQLIHEADVVVAAGTIAATALACGKPTVMLGQGDYTDYVGGRYVHPDHEDVYADQLRYPIDVSEGDLDDLIRQASAGDEAATGWRDRFIGHDGTANAVELLQELVGESSSPSAAHVTIGGVTAKAKLNL